MRDPVQYLGFLILALATTAADARDFAELDQAVTSIFVNSCVECHGPNENARKRFLSASGQYVGRDPQIDARSEFPMVKPGVPEESLLYLMMLPLEDPKRQALIPFTDLMPEGDTPLPKGQRDLVKEWIESLDDRDKPTDPEDPAAEEEGMIEKAALRAILRDLDQRKAAGDDLRFYRYFYIARPYALPDSIELQRRLLTFVLNSVSRGRRIHVPVALPNTNSQVFRIDLRALGGQWYNFDRDLWGDVLRADYPYRFDGDFDRAFDAVEKLVGERFPLFRADWFINYAMEPDNYHELLALPTNLNKLFRDLNQGLGTIDDQYRAQLAKRSGFNNSGVSNFNRIIERLEIPDGYFWQSFDFDGHEANKSIFKAPLGPASFFKRVANSFVTFEVFDHAGGEFIFSLPNGLQGYYLSDQKGNRLNVAPEKIVLDRVAQDAVRNGASCLNCHMNEGLLKRKDMIGPYLESLRDAVGGLPAGGILEKLYDDEAVENFIDSDSTFYQRALNATGMLEVVKTSKLPYFDMKEAYEGRLVYKDGVKELGVTRNFWERAFDFNARKASQDVLSFRAKLENGALDRQSFEEGFSEVRKFLDTIEIPEVEFTVQPSPAVGGTGAVDDEELEIRQINGFIEVFNEDEWKPVCDDQFDERDGEVACRQLGFQGFTRFEPGQRSGNAYWIDEIQCRGNEASLFQCRQQRLGLEDCNDGEGVRVFCKGETKGRALSDEEKGARLVTYGNTRNVLQIFVAGEWGNLCGKKGSDISAVAKVASVACQQMGYAKSTAVKPGVTVSGSDIFSLKDVKCSGSESRVQDCSGIPIADTASGCEDTDHVVVSCSER